jgi:N-acyl-D-amino-acid deacylase
MSPATASEVQSERLAFDVLSSLGIVDRGLVRPGAFADLVLFDPSHIADVAMYADPHHPPAGVVAVLVNGVEVVRDGEHTGTRPGRALRWR